MRFLLYILFLLLSTQCLHAQKGVGFRFATDINYFNRAIEYDLVPGAFSTLIFGPFYRSYTEKGGFEVGINIKYKNGDDQGFPNLPVVMQDFKQEQNVGFTAVELDFKVGPSFRPVNPKIGYIVGYQFTASGYNTPGNEQTPNKIYLALPFGLSVDLPTNFGTVGIGAYYEVGILNVLRNPDPAISGLYDGGRLRSIHLEINVTYGVNE